MPPSRDAILAAIRRQRAPEAPLPAIDNGPWITYSDPAEHFAGVLSSVGGKCIAASTTHEVLRELEQMPAFSTAATVYSLCDGIPNRNVDPHSIADPHELADVDFAVLPARFAVAENGAVWVNDDGVPDRVIYFLAQHVALVVPAGEIVHNMHQAYGRLRFDKAGFGCFISGPSKTADIEQSLVIGAHGARSLTVFLLGATAGLPSSA
jgi:L-lactate dehydrogenase complex protein LldG